MALGFVLVQTEEDDGRAARARCLEGRDGRVCERAFVLALREVGLWAEQGLHLFRGKTGKCPG